MSALDDLWTEEDLDSDPEQYNPLGLKPTADGRSRFLLPSTPAGIPAKTSAQSARLSLERIFEARKDDLLKVVLPPTIDFQLRRLIRDDETGAFTHRLGRVLRKRQQYTPSRNGKFAKLDLAGRSGLLDAWLMGDGAVEWAAPRDEDVFDAAAALCTDAKPPPSGFELIELSALLNRILGARAGVELTVFDLDG